MSLFDSSLNIGLPFICLVSILCLIANSSPSLAIFLIFLLISSYQFIWKRVLVS